LERVEKSVDLPDIRTFVELEGRLYSGELGLAATLTAPISAFEIGDRDFCKSRRGRSDRVLI
jgi:hypothetical protein